MMNMNTNNEVLMISDVDHQSLSSLVSQTRNPVADLLQEELDRASIVAAEQLPKDVVAMNSTVTFIDLETNKESEVTLVYPHEANINEQKISVLAPIGAALIGLRVGQTIKWPMNGGKFKNLKVVAVR